MTTTPDRPEQDTTLDADTFDIGSWLGDLEPDQYRPKRTVHVYVVQPGLSERIDEINAEREKYAAAIKKAKEERGERSIADAGPAVFEQRMRQLDEQMADVLQQVEGAKREVTVVGLIQPEIDAALAKLTDKDPYTRTVALLAAAMRIDGKRIDAAQLAKLHRAIGQGQWEQLVQAFNATTHGDPWAGVTAPF